MQGPASVDQPNRPLNALGSVKAISETLQLVIK